MKLVKTVADLIAELADYPDYWPVVDHRGEPITGLRRGGLKGADDSAVVVQ